MNEKQDPADAGTSGKHRVSLVACTAYTELLSDTAIRLYCSLLTYAACIESVHHSSHQEISEEKKLKQCA